MTAKIWTAGADVLIPDKEGTVYANADRFVFLFSSNSYRKIS